MPEFEKFARMQQNGIFFQSDFRSRGLCQSKNLFSPLRGNAFRLPSGLWKPGSCSSLAVCCRWRRVLEAVKPSREGGGVRSKLRQQSSPLVLPGWGVCYEVIYSDFQWKDLDPSTSLRAFLGSKSPSLGLFDDSAWLNTCCWLLLLVFPADWD